jgi:NAD(P)-dependent dehydrogenase (short-subunit alcohol dehydrogenase family)
MEQNYKVAVITGAGSGIGRAIASGVSGMGIRTVLIGRDLKKLKKVEDEICEGGGLKPAVFQLDIKDYDAVSLTVGKILDKFGRIDILVNNAGVYYDGTLDLSKDDFSDMLETNLTAQFVFLKEVVPILKNQGSGYIFNVVSRSGKTGFAGSGAYCASKFGLWGLSEFLYHELVPQGIRVTALCPAWTNTDMAYVAGTPLEPQQMIQPDDLFKTIKWLLSLSPGACVKEVVIVNPLSL